MFVSEGGLYNFNLFDQYAGSIQLLFCLLTELFCIPWIFGMHKLSVLMYIRTGQKIPVFIIFAIKTIIPVFILIVFVIGWVNEFDSDHWGLKKGRVDAGWTFGHLWAGRLIWIIPLLAIPIGTAFLKMTNYEIESIDNLVETQFGIRFKDN